MAELLVTLDDDLIELLDAQVAESGRPRSEVLAAAIRSGLGGGRLAETLAAYRTGEQIPEDEAMALATAEREAAHYDRDLLVRMAEASAADFEAELFGD